MAAGRITRRDALKALVATTSVLTGCGGGSDAAPAAASPGLPPPGSPPPPSPSPSPPPSPSPSPPPSPPSPPSPPPPLPAVFPLQALPGKRYLTDSTGRPFFLLGDTAWSLACNLSREEVVEYLNNRQAKGFNAFSVNLVEHHYSKHTPPWLNYYGDQPFSVPGDFSTPNGDYWQMIDFIFQQASLRNMLILAFHSYNGFGGGNEGWYQEMTSNGVPKLFSYGQFLGTRYAAFKNVMWMSGGDYDAPDKSLLKAVVNGINSVFPNALHSHHGHRETDTLHYWSGDLAWFKVNALYDRLGHSATLANTAYTSPNWKPFFRIEDTYEQAAVSDTTIRMLAYGSVLQGGMGAVYGHVAVWPFGGRFLVPSPLTWREAMDSACARSMMHFAALFTARSWTKLVPDYGNRTFMTNGWGADPDFNFAALAADGSFGIAYLSRAPSGLTIDLGKLAGPAVRCRWYDPTNAAYQEIGTFPASGLRLFNPVGDNAGGFSDWVLVMESTI